MKNYITPENKIYGFDDTQTDIIPADAVLIPETYTTSQYPFLSLVKGEIQFDEASYNTKIHAETIANYNFAAQVNLDQVAQSWGYNSFDTPASYANSTNAQFKADAEALIKWRDIYWLQAYTIEAGTLPTSAEIFVNMLPVAPIKPVI